MVDEQIPTAPSPAIQLSLVLPIYNFAPRIADHIQRIVNELQEASLSFEIIAVDDGSRDQTYAQLCHLQSQYPELCVLHDHQNRGKGYAVRQGVLAAQGQSIFFTDIDLSYGLGPIIAGIPILERNEADLLLGSRHLPQSQVIVPYSWSRKLSPKNLFVFGEIAV